MNPHSIFRSALFLLLFSCTIIEDTDVITPADFDKLHLTGIEINQEVNNQKFTAKMNVVQDTAMHVVIPDGIVTRSLAFELSNFQGKKLKFRSGENSTLLFQVTFLSGNRPYNFRIFHNDVILELYRFRYNSSGQLARVSFFLGEDNLITRDSIYYDDEGKITSVEREEYTASPGGNITVEEYINGPPRMVMRFRNNVFTFNSGTEGNCNNNSNRSECFSFNRGVVSGGSGDNKQVNFFQENYFGLLNALTLQENRFGGVSHQPDTYFFHPFMILKTYFENGDDLMVLYMVDWYTPGADGNNQSSNSAEQVKFSYFYGL